MKRILRMFKKGLAYLLCLAVAYTAIPLLNYIDACHEHLHTCCSYEHCEAHDLLGHCGDDECCPDRKCGKGFLRTLFENYSISAEAASCSHQRTSPLYCDAAHPHYVFFDCRDCLSRIYTGGTQYKSNCSTCNPALNCKHTGSKWTDTVHPHPIYCQTCSAVTGYGTSSSCITCNPCALGHSYGSPSYSSTHPHQGYYYCRNCGASKSAGTTTMSNCIQCNPCANGHDFYAYYCEAEHPHANYNYCKRCAYKQYDGTNRFKSNCKQCNPDLQCKHTGEFWTDTAHPHAVYCRNCSDVIQAVSTVSTCSLCKPQGSSTVVISAWTDLTSVTGSGVLSIEHAKTINDYFAYDAWVEPAGSDTIKSITCTGPDGAHAGGYVQLTNKNLGTYTITATTNKGATKTISVTIKTQTPGAGDIRYRTVGMNVKEISGDNFYKSVNARIALESASIIPDSENSKIAAMIGKYDGKTYTLRGPLVISVYNVKTGKTLGEYDVLTDYSELTSDYAWGQNTLQDFQTMQSVDISYQAPRQINATAIYCSQDKGTIYGSITAQQLGAPQYIFPYETYTVAFTNNMVGVPSGMQYHGVQWIYNPQGNGYTNGSAVGQTSVSVTFNKDTPVCTFYFYWKEATGEDPKETKTGSITVSAYDASTGAFIPNARVSVAGKSGSNGTTFADLPLGSYTATASASGYYSGSGTTTLTEASPNSAISIPLQRVQQNPAEDNGVEVGIEIQANGVYRKGSTVMVSAICTSDKDILPTDPATVTFRATYLKKSGSGYVTSTITSQQKEVIIPGGEANLAWFEFSLPASDYYNDSISLECKITPPDNMSGRQVSASKTIPVSNHVIRSSPKTEFEKSAPPAFRVPNPPEKAAPQLTWEVWEWIDNGFVKKTYSAMLNTSATLDPDSTAGYRVYNNATGLWSTRSGYGLNTLLTVSVNNTSGAVTGNAKADVYYPEYNYTYAKDKSNNLQLQSKELSGGTQKYTFTFEPDQHSISGNRMHKTPVWYPDGQYTVFYNIFDIWTPAGELTATEKATIIIDGNMYDDSYVVPVR